MFVYNVKFNGKRFVKILFVIIAIIITIYFAISAYKIYSNSFKVKDEIINYLIENGFKKYNASQIIDFIYKKKIYDFNVMSNLSLKLREFCNSHFEVNDLKLITKEESKLANKYLFELNDGNKIECVLMFHDYGNSLCISSQVGCNMGCAFCESGRLNFYRANFVATR